MKRMKQILALGCAVLMLLALPVSATEPSEETTLPPILVGVQQLNRVPTGWNPLDPVDENQGKVLELTSQPLYRLTEGGVVPEQAAELPVDVTAEFAGSFGISPLASRGYAFAIQLRPELYWDDGRAVTVTDWLYTMENLLRLDRFPLEIAGYAAYLRGDTHPAEQIVSLMDAGYTSAMEAEAAGIADFYLDSMYWGLEEGWFRITDKTRLFDEAIPSGCEEMYVTPAYLYREYLSSDGAESMFHAEFVGIPVQAGEPLSMADVGLLIRDNRLILILEEPATPTHVALSLCGLYPVPTGADAAGYGTAATYRSCGPYRVEMAGKNEILLVPNEYWAGEQTEFEQIRCVVPS